MTAPASTVQIRKAEEVVDVVPLEDVRLRMFDAAVPWREFRWYKKQRHFSGSYWSATMEAPVGYESRLEYANLLLADFDPRVGWILSQPFLLEGDDRGKMRRAADTSGGWTLQPTSFCYAAVATRTAHRRRAPLPGARGTVASRV